MNPLMDALKSAEHARPAPAERGADGSPGPAALQFLSLAGEGPADGGAPARPLFIDAASTPFERRPDDVPHPFIPAEPARVMVDDADPAGLRIRRPPPERSGVGESRSATRRAFDPRTLPRRRGIGRLVGTTLSLFVVIGIGTGGGYFIWKTEFVRPALVRHLSPMPVAAMEPAPAHAANAAMDVTGGSAAGAALGDGRESGGLDAGRSLAGARAIRAVARSRGSSRTGWSRSPLGSSGVHANGAGAAGSRADCTGAG